MKLLTAPILSICLVFVLASCEKDDDEFTIEEEDAVSMLNSSLSNQSESIQEDTEAYHSIRNNFPDSLCGDTIPIAYSYSRTVGSRSFSWNADGTRENICSGDTLIAFDYITTFNTTYNGPNWESSGNGNRVGRLSQFDAASTEYRWNGNANKTTNGVLKARRETSISLNIKMNSNILINKAIRRISGGTTNFEIEGTGENMNPFSYTGTIEYLGNRQAIVRVNGNSYTVNY